MGKEKLIPIFAMIVLLLGAISSVYVYATQVDKETITINDQDYTIDQLFYLAEPRELVTSQEEVFSGIALDDLVKKVGIVDPSSHEYTIIGDDDYQKTVNWENMKYGLITNDRMVVFSDLPKAFRIRNVVIFEVI